MHVVIMGCGRVGSTLAFLLIKRGYSVAIIDQDPLAFRRLGDNFPGQQVTGIGFDRETLAEAGIDKAGAFAAVSSGDNSNIIAARVARETFNVARVVARIYDPKRAEVYERLGIPTVATVTWTANRLLKNVLGEATAEAWHDPSGAVVMLHVTPHEGWVGRRVSEFQTATTGRVALITRFGIGEVPTRETVIQDGDSLHVLAPEAAADEVRERLAAPPEERSAE